MEQHRTTSASQPRGMERYSPDLPPDALLIVCTDPILDSRLLARFRSAPLLVWRTTGPVVPPYGAGYLDADRVIDYAVNEMGVKEIIICGHLPSELLQTLISSKTRVEKPEEDPSLYYIQSALRIVEEKYGPLQQDELLQALVEENVLMQMVNLRTYPAVLSAMADGKLRLHSWIYYADEDELYGYGPGQSLFLKRIEPFAEPAEDSLPYLDPCDVYLA